MTKIATKADLKDLIDKIKHGNTHFIGYEPPIAMVAYGNQMYEVPIGHFIPALMDALGQGVSSGQQNAQERSAR